MKFKLVECPETFTLEDRLCRSCKQPTMTPRVLMGEGTDYYFASCATFECQEKVKNQILKAIARAEGSGLDGPRGRATMSPDPIIFYANRNTKHCCDPDWEYGGYYPSCFACA